MGKLKILDGQIFGKLTVINESEKIYLPSGQTNRVFLCKCECGNIKNIRLCHLKHGRSTSCGCNIGEKHPNLIKKLYSVYHSMRQRCSAEYTSESTKNRYKNRGITVCLEWIESYNKFQQWALNNGYEDGLEIDRIDNDKGYSPQNCRWVTRTVNSNNMSTNRPIEYNGVTMNLTQWANKLNMPYSTLRNRIENKNNTIQDAFEKPIGKNGNRANKRPRSL